MFKLLDRTEYRLVRTADDLLDVALEVLSNIEADFGYDCPMLYGPPSRTSAKTPRKHLEDDALKAYLRRRFRDLLPQVTDGVEIDITAQDEISHRWRLDLRMTAPGLSKVVIEIKWSTNTQTKTGLIDQLAKRYSLEEERTHGIYVVGWPGKWSRPRGAKVSDTIEGLRQYLKHQRDEFYGEKEGLRIEPVVLDLQWRDLNAKRHKR